MASPQPLAVLYPPITSPILKSGSPGLSYLFPLEPVKKFSSGDYLIYFSRLASFALGIFSVSCLLEAVCDTAYFKMLILMDCDYPQAVAAGTATWPIVVKAAAAISVSRVTEAIKLMPGVFGSFFVFEGRGKFKGNGYYGPLKVFWPILFAFIPLLIFQLGCGVWDVTRRMYGIPPSTHYYYITFVNKLSDFLIQIPGVLLIILEFLVFGYYFQPLR